MTGPAERPAMTALPLGCVRPAGWLLDQLRLQADGLGGHLDEFWPSLTESAWVGGRGEAWERGPYWLDGVIPLAVLLDDQALMARVRRWVDHILEHPQADGRLGPVMPSYDADHRDPWPLVVLTKALRSWHEATNDPRVLPALQRTAASIASQLERTRLREWAHYRAADLAWGMLWLHERTGDPVPLQLARTALAQGFDWTVHAHGDGVRHTRTDGLRRCGGGCSETHGVNVAMGVKHGAVRWLLTGDEADRTGPVALLEALDRWHGQVTGVFTCDEHLAGRSPSQGTELCAVVELLWSLEVVLGTTGDPSVADRWERVAFNALPAAFSPSMWAHQYDQQVNQVRCAWIEDPVYTDNGPDANLFGVEVHFGCCTANFHQGWPKFAQHAAMATTDGAIALQTLAPLTVDAEVPGGRLHLDVGGGYPFVGAAHVVATVDGTSPVQLDMRIPAWAEGATVDEGGCRVAAKAGAYHRVVLPPGRTVLDIRLPRSVCAWRGESGSAALTLGPIVLSRPVPERWVEMRRRGPAVEWGVEPEGAWAHGLAVDPGAVAAAVTVEEGLPQGAPFTLEATPLRVHVPTRPVSGWDLDRGAAAAPLPKPPARDVEVSTFVPYACARLRVTELPLVPPAD